MRVWNWIALVLCVAMVGWTLIVVLLTHDAVSDLHRALLTTPGPAHAEPRP